jgi:uncharacterized membrane protein
MPFCTQCGSEARPADRFCGTCGAKQGTPAEPSQGSPAESSSESSASSPWSCSGSSFKFGPKSGSHKMPDFLGGMNPRVASLLCYIPIVGWIASIVVLASERFRENRDVRFHAFQGLYLFVVWLFVDWVFGPITAYADSTRYLGKLLKATVFFTWIWMLIKTSQDQLFRLPFLGDLAERSVSEQK